MPSQAELAMILRAKDEGVKAVFDSTKGAADSWSSGISGAVGKVISGFSGFGAAVAGVQTAIEGIKGIGSVFGIGALSEMEQTRASFMAFTKDAAKTEEIMAQVRTEAAKTPFAFGEMAKATASLMPVAKSSGAALMDLVKEAEILAASNPLEGLEGASFSLREAMTGDFTSIIERFNLSRTTINKLKEEGVPNLEIVRKAMAEMGFDSDLIAAKAETLEGRWSTFLDTMTTLQTKMGQPIFDALKDGLVGLQGALDGNMGKLEDFAGLVAGGLRQAIELGKVAFGQLMEAWSSLGRSFSEGGMMGALRDLGPRLASLLANLGGLIVEQVEGWAKSFAAWVDGAEMVQGSELAQMAQSLMKWIIDTAAAIIEKLGEWGAAFVDWIAPKIPPMLRALGEYLAEMAGWMLGTGLPMILEKLGEWGLAFVEWVGPRIIPLLYELGKLEAELLGWIIGTALPAIVSKLGEWALAFVQWVPGAVVNLLFELGRLEFQFLGWIAGRVGAVASAALELGSGLVGGIRDGIANALGGFWDWLQRNFVDRIPDFVRELLNIHSPSGVFADIGANIVEGLRVGMEGRLPSIDDIIERVIGRVGGMSGDVDAWLKTAMKYTGAPDSWLGPLKWIVGHESGGDPRAKNPNSTAAGLFQMIDTTWAASRDKNLPNDIFNPIINAIAGIRYIMGRYGDPFAAVDFWKKNNHYATGGIAWGPQLAMVGEREPEAIIPRSWFARSGGGGGGVYIAPGAIVIQGSLVHERDLEQVVMHAVGGGLRHGIPLGRSR